MSVEARFLWVVALIVAGTVGATFLPLGLCVVCDLGAGVLAARGAR